MKYWDSSALVPLILEQARSADMVQVLDQDSSIVTWWGSSVECCSALMRLMREGTLPHKDVLSAENRLRLLRQAWDDVLPGETLRRTSERLLRVHPLRAGDALQLAAALMACEHDPERLKMVCLDTRLAEAARIEGFSVLG